MDERQLESEREQMQDHDSRKHYRENHHFVVFTYAGEGAPVPIDDYKGKILYDANPKKLKN